MGKVQKRVQELSMVETQTKNQDIFWVWNTAVDFIRRGDVDFWSPEYVKNDKLMSQYVPFTDVIEGITNGVELRKYSDSGELYLRVSNIKEFFTDLNDIKLVPLTREAVKAREKVRLSEQDILMSRSGSLGIITIITPDIKDAIISSHIMRLRVKDGINPYYIATFLNCEFGKNQILRRRNGSPIPEINHQSLEELRFFIPSKSIQQKVEQIVKDAFQLKKEAEKERQEADLILENSIKRFFTIDEQRAFWKWNTDIEIIKTLEPNFWKKTISSKKHPTIEFGDIFNYQKGTEVGSALYQDSGIPFLRVSDLGDLEIQFGNSSKYINETLFDELKAEFQSHKGELLFSKDATIGLMAKVETEEKQIISSGILRLQIKNKEFDPDFLMAFLTNKFINQEFVKNSTGSVIKHLNAQKLSKIELPLIDKQVQKEVANKIKSSISKKQFSRQKLQEAKDFVENLIKRYSE